MSSEVCFPARVAVAAGGAFLALALMSGTALAQNNVKLDNLRITMPEGKSTLTIPSVEVTNTNLTRDEVATFFSTSLKSEEAAALGARMTADRISIPSAVLAAKDSQLTFGPFLATGVNAGKVDKASLGGFTGTFNVEGAGEGSVTGRAIAIEGTNLAALLQASRTGDMTGVTVQMGRFSFAGFDASFPDKETPKTASGGNLWKVKLDSIEANSTYEGAVPVKSTGDFKGLVVEPPKASKFGQALLAFGYPRIDAGFGVTATYDPKARTLALGNYSLRGVDAGVLAMSGDFGQLGPEIFTATGPARLQAAIGGDISRLEVKFVNQGLFDKALGFLAKQQKKTPASLKAEWAAMATQVLPLLLGGDPSSLSLAQSIQTFINDPKSLRIVLKSRGAPVPIAQLRSIADPATFLALVDISAKANE